VGLEEEELKELEESRAKLWHLVLGAMHRCEKNANQIRVTYIPRYGYPNGSSRSCS
jgi:hypothetical protein